MKEEKKFEKNPKTIVTEIRRSALTLLAKRKKTTLAG